jgi:hypothetical protein
VETTPASGGALQLLLLLALLVPAIFFIITQQNTLKAVQPENRLMHPGLVWLQLIPLFSNIWQFFVVIKIAGSIQRQLASRHADSIFGADALIAEGAASRRPTQGIGIAYCIIEIAILLNNLFASPASDGNLQFAGLLGLAMFVCWIIYWVKLARYKNKLKRALAWG